MKNKNIKRIIVLIYLLALQIGISQNFEWAKAMGGTDRDKGVSITTDALGNVYTTGEFSGTADFDPGFGVYNLTAIGDYDAFISKIDANGNFVWAKNLGGTGVIFPKSIAVDAVGNVYTVGEFLGTVDFHPASGGVFNLTSYGIYDIYLSKLDPDGNFISAINFGGTDSDFGEAIHIDALGNMYITGYFQDTVDFDPSSSTYNINANFNNTFILKLDASGNLIWAKNLVGSQNYPFAMKTDDSGNIYIVGYFDGLVDFNFNAGTDQLMSQSADVFILKLDTSGNYIWAKSVGGANPDFATDVCIDASGNTYITGVFNDTADFNPSSTEVYNLTSYGTDDVFILKLNALGNFVGAKHIGGPGRETPYSINIDTSRNIYITGTFQDTVDFNSGSDTYNVTSSGHTDLFILKLDVLANFIDVITIGRASTGTIGYGTVIDASDNLYTTGYFSQIVDFNPFAETANLTALGDIDAFVQKLNMGTTLNTYDNTFKETLIAFPNPTSKSSTINLGKLYSEVTLTISTITGQLISTRNYKKTDNIDFNIDGDSGLYFAEILADDKKATLKIVKQ